MGWRLTGAAVAWWLSGDEGVVQVAQEGSLGQSGALGLARGGVEAMSQAAHGGPWWWKMELNGGAYRSGQANGGTDKKQGEGFCIT
jgi:hypothetical protein